MSFISYAQNFEDVMLWRALQSVGQGNYIDIGAQDPVVDSVSLAFHERGWHGLHVEPNVEYAAQLKQARPGDEVRQVAVGRESGSITFYEIDDTGLSTGSAEIAEQHRQQGFPVRKIEVPLVTLDELLDARADQAIHWLKIDVEGMEADIIAGWQQSAVRPWIVLLESCQPTSQTQTHEEWEPHLLSKGYRFVYFDGVNRLYLSSEHPELADAFSAPPNVFDEFTFSGQASHAFCLYMRHQVHLVEVRAAEAEADAWHAQLRIAEIEAQLHAANQRTQQVQEASDAALRDIYSSRSWRLAAPVRVTGRELRLLREQGATRYVRSLARRCVVRMASVPALRRVAAVLLRHSPRLSARLKGVLHGPPATIRYQILPDDQTHLTARARRLRGSLVQTTDKESQA